MQPSGWKSFIYLVPYVVPMRSIALLAVSLVCLPVAGCIASPGPASTGQIPDADVSSEVITDTVSFESPVSAGFHVTEETLDVAWTTEQAPEVLDVEAVMTWEEPANAFGLEVQAPDGTHDEPAPSRTGDDVVDISIDDPGAGTFEFRPTAEGPVAPDTLELTVVVTRRTQSGPSGDVGVSVEQQNGDWYAEIAYTAEGPARDQMDAEVDVANGYVHASRGGDNATVTVTAWARAGTREAAVERAREIDVRVLVDEGRIVGRADAPSWNNRGAHADLQASTVLSGDLSTSNGKVELSDLQADAIRASTSNGAVDATGTYRGTLSLSTSNGQIGGDVEVHGDLSATTSNGKIDLDVTPRSTLRLDVGSSNGAVDLGLNEDADTAYEVDASTSNGQLSEDMDEAHLEGGDRSATLVTEGGDGRPIQVTGDVDTSNADVHFRGI